MIDHNVISKKIIGCAYIVSNRLGVGFLEKVYENALCIELKKACVPHEQQKAMKIIYDGICIGEYCADILVDNAIIVELKTVRYIDEIHQAQIINYLKASDKKLGLIINFATPKIEIKRMANGL